MKTFFHSMNLLALGLILFLVGCTLWANAAASSTQKQALPSPTPTHFAASKTSTPSPTHKSTATSLPTATATFTLTPRPTKTPTPLPPTWTPLPTLPADEARDRVAGLFKNNGGCSLPCWWGITPGKTTWQEAKSFLEAFTEISIRGNPQKLGSLDILIPLPKESKVTWHYYLLREGVVDDIKAYNYDLVPAFYLPAFLKTYGQPGEIWMRTYREEEQNSQPFLLDLFYPDQGILMEYSGGNLVDLGDHLRNCMKGMNSPFIYLWSPEHTMTFDEAQQRFLDTEDFPQPISLEDATGMDVKTFYEKMITTGRACIQTPKELWP